MKKIQFLVLLIIIFLLQSCKIDSDITYHKDAATTTVTNINFKEFMSYINDMKPDSLKDDGNDDFAKQLNDIPKNWKSLYEIKKEEDEDLPSDEDSLRFYKKMFLKSYVVDGETAGISFKMDRLSQKDMKEFNIADDKESGLLMSSIEGYEWDGKKLIIDTENFKMNELRKAMMAEENEEEEEVNDEKLSAFMDMIKLTMSSQLHFEGKIKKIKGKHDFIRQIDNHTMEIKIDHTALTKENELKNNDQKVIIYVD